MSKGSRQRPRQISREQFHKNWNAIFKQYKQIKELNKVKEETKDESTRN